MATVKLMYACPSCSKQTVHLVYFIDGGKRIVRCCCVCNTPRQYKLNGWPV